MRGKSILTQFLLYLLFLAVVCPAATGEIIYVDDDGSADFDTIQAAIDDANDGDTVLVAAGTYTGDGNRDIDFAGKAITVKSENGPQTCIIDCQGSEDDPHRGFYFHSGEEANSVIEGFTITGGYITRYASGGRTLHESGSQQTNDFILTDNQVYSGGAIAVINSSIRIADCIVRENIATNGGGIFCENGGVVIEQCLIEENQADFGGGIICSSTGGDILVINCIIKSNTAESTGGGLICGDGTNVSGCLIVGNSADGKADYYNGVWPSRALKGGGGVALYGTGAVLNNCTISENKANTGSGILTGCRFDYLDWAFIYNSIIFNNSGGDRNQVVISPCCPMCVRIIAPVGIQAYYCCIQGTPTMPEQWPYSANDSYAEYINCIDIDPLFAAPGYWTDVSDPNIIAEPNDPNAVWIDGDYHLKSQAGRFDPTMGIWVLDEVTSLCIDAGDPNTPVGDEPFPNGGIVNMGAYGGTSEASKSYTLAKTIYVDDDATGANDGSSWQNAYTFLQDALADAETSEKPVEIRVAQGIYKPDQGTGQTQGNRGATFRLINNVKLVGGYAGLGQYDPNARDIGLFQTILSGDLYGNDVDVNTPGDLLDEPTRAENSYHVVSGSGTDETAVLNGLTITAGNTKGSNQYSYGVGGGMYNHRSEPNLINCTFSGNVAGFGGGMFNRYSKPILTNCIFKDNSAKSYGGGMYNYQSIITSVINCIFSGNSAGHGGGIYIESSSTPQNCQTILISCTFSENLAEYAGGGLLLNSKNYSYNYSSNFSLTNCTFKANGAGDTGGGIYVYGGESTLRNCLFHCNSGENGNALACYSYLYGDPSVVELTNCILWDDGNQIWDIDGSIITITYSDIKDGQASMHDPYEKIVWGIGNIDSDPYFADPANHDYHLKSQAGRWDPNNKIWIKDDVTSPCIDTGDPNSPIGYESSPNGHRINMGIFGGTQQASMSIYDVDTFKPARFPNPHDGAVDVVLDIIPGWISDSNVVMHDIYFGTSELPPFFRKQLQSEFYPGALEPDTRYYWRIDDIDNLLNRAVGNIWTFLTGPQPAHAYGPNPVNGTDDVVAYRIILAWCPGLKAVEHNVYLGTNFEDVRQATTENPLGVLVSIAQEPNYFNPGGLEFEQTYYWRVDEIDDHGIITPDNIWTFTTGPQPVNAYNPNPPDGARGVSPNVTLSWSPGKNTVAHDIYFGSTYPPMFVRNQTETEFDPGQLGSQQKCYWRIDEIDNQGNIITGDEWKFSVTEYKGRLCFTGQTPVWINDSFTPISKVGIGQSTDGIHRIEEVQEHKGTYTLYDILLESGNSITVAENHIFMTESGNWLSLHKLTAGMRLKTLRGSIGIKSITKQQALFTGKVYNIKIQGSDQYIIGKDMVIVCDY